MMNILRYGARLIERTTPAGIIFTGAALALAFPPVRRSLRTVAVTAVGGVLTIADEAKNIVMQPQKTAKDIISEAQSDDCCPSCSDFTESVEDVRSAPRRMAVKAAAGVLAATDKAKSVVQNVSEQMQGIVDEAKRPRHKHHSSVNNSVIRDGLEVDEPDIPNH